MHECIHICFTSESIFPAAASSQETAYGRGIYDIVLSNVWECEALVVLLITGSQ